MWHDVLKDGLPKESGQYNVFIREPIKKETYGIEAFEEDLSYVSSAYFDKDACTWCDWPDSYFNARIDCVNTEEVYHITHWMELPNKPEV